MEKKDSGDKQGSSWKFSFPRISKKSENDTKRKTILKKRDSKSKEEKKAKKNVKVVQTEKRHSSQDQNLKYSLPGHHDGSQPQPSRTFQNLKKRPSLVSLLRPNRLKNQQRLADLKAMPTDRDSNDAADFYNSSTMYRYNRGSHVNLRMLRRKSSQVRVRRSRSSVSVKKLYQRCNTCLQYKEKCVCHEVKHKPSSSDWAIILQPEPQFKPKYYTKPSLSWLVKLEEQSVIDKKKLIEEKFSKNQDMCCFPFNTFNLFKKKDIVMVDYYIKN